MWSIREREGRWEVTTGEGDTLTIVGTHDTYAAALAHIASQLDAQLATVDNPEAGLLPETWRSDVILNADTGDGRDFTDCQFTWRDPSTHLVPLMLQTETDMGHFGAHLAGFWTSAAPGEGNVAIRAGGRFYDNEHGRQFRDMLQGGRRFGVSADGGAVDVEWECVETEEMDMGDGDTIEVCVEDRLIFRAYEAIGSTGTPFPGFADCFIELDVAPAEQPAMAASGGRSRVPARPWTPPPLAAFDRPDVDRPTPMTVSDTGRVFFHLAAWGTCHVGRSDICIEPPHSASNYAYFRTGAVRTSEGRDVAVGAYTMGIGHADLSLNAQDAAAHYDDTRYGVADLAAGEDQYGIWCAGVVRPGVTRDQVYVLRASSGSGDWRRIAGSLELVAALGVNTPGFPIPRQLTASLTASGAPVPVPMASMQVRADLDGCYAMVASGVVKRVVRERANGGDVAGLEARLARLEGAVRLLAPEIGDKLAHRIGR